MLGEGSKAYFWPESESSQDSDSEAEELADQLEQTHINDDNDDSCSSLSISRSDSMDSLSSLDSDVSIDLDKPLNARDSSAFDNELRQSLERAFTEGHPIDNLVIELKTMRMSSNVPISDVRNGFLHYLLSQVPLATSPDVPMKERDVVIGPLVKRWGGVVTTLAPLDEADMVEVMLTLQRLHAPTTSRDFPIWLKHFYQEDVISEEAVLEWWKDSESRRDEGLKAVRQAAAPFVKAVLESGSDDSDEDDSEESEEDHE